MICFADKIKEISFALFDIQYEFEGYSDNHDVYFKFREYKICLSKAKDNIWLSKNGSKLVEGTWQEVKILEQIGKIYVPDSAQTLNEFKNLASEWNIYLKQRFIDKRKFEIEKDFYKDEDDVSEDVVQEEKDSSDKPLPIYKRFAKNLLNVFKKDSK